jgi:hypothetical protein
MIMMVGLDGIKAESEGCRRVELCCRDEVELLPDGLDRILTSRRMTSIILW